MATNEARRRVVWLQGVFAWGLGSAIVWCLALKAVQPSIKFSEQIDIALLLFPAAGYVAGRIMWAEQLADLRQDPSPPARPVVVERPVVEGVREGELSPNLPRAARVWFALAWRTVVCGFASMFFGGVAGALVGVVLGGMGISTESIEIVAETIGAIGGLMISVIPVWLILGKDFGEFRIALLARRPIAETVPVSGVPPIVPTQAGETVPPSSPAADGGTPSL